MAGVESKSLDSPEEVRTPEKTNVDVVTVGGTEVGRFTFEPGWRWSECIKPVVGTDSCQPTSSIGSRPSRTRSRAASTSSTRTERLLTSAQVTRT